MPLIDHADRVSRLPKWAQNERENDRRKIAELQRRIAELTATFSESPLQVDPYADAPQGLKPGSMLSFDMRPSPDSRNFGGRVTVTLERDARDGRKYLAVHGGERLGVYPQSGNGINVYMEDR